jgi:hypothetical protein
VHAQTKLAEEAGVATFTPTAYPYVGFTDSPRIAVVAAKCSDELGRLGALLMTEAPGRGWFRHAADAGFPVIGKVSHGN